MKVLYNTVLITFFTLPFYGQSLDSIQKLEEVVVTGQYSKQSVKKSVYEVKVINTEKIKQFAANNLADLLNQSVNIQIIPNPQTGKSQISLFGLDGQYVKILVDGIPLVSDEGFGNNIDLTQINLEDIEQIEIVEGAMGVEYGANAVTGIINLITKKSATNKGSINLSFQEETIGDEYEWWAKGRHIQNLNMTNNITKHLYSNITISRNHFTGYLNEKLGKNHIVNDSLRGYQWLPKEQTTGNANLHYKKNNFNAFYKFGIFKEFLTYYSSKITSLYNTQTQQIDKTANDRDYKSLRFSHNINLNYKFPNEVLFDFSTAYQTQHRDFRTFVYDLYTRESTKEPFKEYLNRNTFFAKSTVSNFIKSNKFNMQLGSEYNYEEGYSAAASTQYSFADASNKMSNFDLFITSEIKPTDKLQIRPGFRYSFQTFLDNQNTWSLSTKYKFTDNFELRNVIGTSYRTPGYEELFTYFVDNTHNIQGNKNLKPEKGFSVFTHLKMQLIAQNFSQLNTQFTFGFLDLNEKIDLAVVKIDPLEYLYINVSNVKSLEFSLDNTFKYRFWDVKMGINLSGKSDRFTDNTILDKYLFNFNANFNVFYNWEKYDLSFSYTHKYNGENYEYWADIDDSDQVVFSRVVTNAYQWADVSFKKYFFKKSFDTTFGIRNLFDVTRVNKRGYGQGGEAHSNFNNAFITGYGRSYFIKLAYNLDIK